jgi:hypothetical protein
MYKCVVFIMCGFLALPLMAQNESKAEIFGGYQYLHIGNNSTLGSSGQGFNGWNAAGAYNFAKNIGVEGDFSGTYATISGVSAHVYTYTGGPIISAKMGSIRPFAHVLFGGARFTGSASGASVSWNGFTTMAGGGVDAKVSKALAVRVAQVDWLYYHFGSKTIGGTSFPSFSGSNNVRISTGLVFRF